MSTYQIAPVVTAILVLCICIFVVFQNRKSQINIVFGFLSLSIFVWLAGFSAMYFSSNPEQALFFARLGFVGVTIIPFLSYHFIAIFLNRAPSVRFLILLYTLIIPILFMTPTRLMYSDIEKHFWGYYPIAGPFYFISPIMFVLLILYGLILLGSGNKQVEARKREQKKYIFVAFVAVILGFVDYLPKYGVNIYPFGYLSALSFISIIAYSITKYRLMDIRIAINRIMAYLLLIAIYFSAGIAASCIYAQFFSFGQNAPTFLFLGTMLIIAGLSFHPLRLHLQTTPDRFLFRKKYEYEQAIREFGEQSRSEINTNKLQAAFTAITTKLLRTKRANLFLFDQQGKHKK